MVDPNADHGFVYTNGIADIDRSPFFDVKPVIDITIGGCIRRIKFTLSIAIEEHLGVYNKLREDYADTPLHPSYAALQTLYRVDHTPDPTPTDDLRVHPSLPSDNFTGIMYFGLILLLVALSILVKSFYLA